MPPLFRMRNTEIGLPGLSETPSKNIPIVIEGTLYPPNNRTNPVPYGSFPIKDSNGNNISLPPGTIVTNIFLKSSSDYTPIVAPVKGSIHLRDALKNRINASSQIDLSSGLHPIGDSLEFKLNSSVILTNNFIGDTNVYPYYEIPLGQSYTNLLLAGTVKVVFILQKI